MVTNITKNTCRGSQRSSRDFDENQKYQNHFTYSAIASSDKYPIKNYEGEKIFNEAGFLEIAIFRSNPSKVGSASSLLGLNYQDVVSIQFKNSFRNRI
jgi:hypothetical protein